MTCWRIAELSCWGDSEREPLVVEGLPAAAVDIARLLRVTYWSCYPVETIVCNHTSCESDPDRGRPSVILSKWQGQLLVGLQSDHGSQTRLIAEAWGNKD